MSDALPTSAATPTPTPKESVYPAAEQPPAPDGIRTVIAKAERIPWPRRTIAIGLLAAVLALLLHALPRPYQPLATRSVQELGSAYTQTRDTYRGEVAALESYAGEATPEERAAYARELWRYKWLGVYREILLRVAEWVAASCVFLSLALIVVERRRARRALEQAGVRLQPAVLHRETLAGESLDAPGPAPIAPPVPPANAPPAPGPAALRTGDPPDEVTPPAPTPVPKPAPIPGMLDLRPIDDDGDFDRQREDESGAPNLAKRAPKTEPARPPQTPGPAPLPQLFLERRHDPSHPVVHPGEATPLPAADETLSGATALPPVTPSAPVLDEKREATPAEPTPTVESKPVDAAATETDPPQAPPNEPPKEPPKDPPKSE